MAVPISVGRGRPHSVRRSDLAWIGRALFAAIAWGVLAFGAVYPWAYWPLAAVCAGIGVSGLVAGAGWRLRRPDRLALGFWIVAAAIAVQALPLPYDVFRSLAPAADRFFQDYQVGYAIQPPAQHALSLSPESTLEVLLLFGSLALLLIGLLHAFHERLSVERLVTRLLWLGVGVAVFGVIQSGFNYKDHSVPIYGFWTPSQGGRPFGPFVNRNHFAGWMILVLPLAIGYAFTVLERSRRPRRLDWGRWASWATTPDASRFLIPIVASMVMGTALILTGSRSGVGGFGVGVLTLAYFVARRLGGRGGRLAALALVSVIFLGAVAWAGVAFTVTRFSLVSADAPGRWTAWMDTLRIIRDFPFFGVGLGNYGLAMFVYQTAARDPLNGMFMQAHNDYLQLAAEGGLIVGIPVLLAAAALIRTIVRRVLEGDEDPLTYWARAGAIAGLAGMAAQSLVEFSLQMPGITVLFTVLLAVAAHQAPMRSAGAGGPVRSGTLDAHRI